MNAGRLTDPREREHILQWAGEVQAALSEAGQPSAAKAVEKAAKDAQADRFRIAVIGQVKRGKSTLINALLGRQDDQAAPVDMLPASATVSEFSWAEQESATVIHHDGRQEAIPFSQIKEYATEQGNPDNRKQVAGLDIRGPFQGLDHDVVLVDTPGAGSVHEHHDELLHAYIPKSDAVIFLVSASMPIDRDEAELLAAVKKADVAKIFFAINRCDAAEPEEIEDGVRHNLSILEKAGLSVGRIHRISAKKAMLGDWDGSGVESLAVDIRAFLAANKAKVLNQRLATRLASVMQPVCHGLAVEIASVSKSKEAVEAELVTLREQADKLEADRTPLESRFKDLWGRSVRDFRQQVNQARPGVEAKVRQEIASYSDLTLAGLQEKLPRKIIGWIEETLAAPSMTMEEQCQDAVKALAAAYPRLDIAGFTGDEIVIRHGSGTTAKHMGGAVAVAGAGGVAVAVAAAAATTTTVAVGTTMSGVLGIGASLAGAAGWAPVAALLGGASSLATGTAVVSTTPVWAVALGPVGWAIGGLGLLAVPVMWKVARTKGKKAIEEQAVEGVRLLFKQVQEERVPMLIDHGDRVAEDCRFRLQEQVDQVRAALERAKKRAMDDKAKTDLPMLETRAARLRDLAEQCRGWLPG